MLACGIVPTLNCTMKRLEGQDYICDMGKTEARIPKKEQSRVETFSIGDRVRCVIKGIERGGKNSVAAPLGPETQDGKAFTAVSSRVERLPSVA